jgi:hypothetical protein
VAHSKQKHRTLKRYREEHLDDAGPILQVWPLFAIPHEDQLVNDLYRKIPCYVWEPDILIRNIFRWSIVLAYLILMHVLHIISSVIWIVETILFLKVFKHSHRRCHITHTLTHTHKHTHTHTSTFYKTGYPISSCHFFIFTSARCWPMLCSADVGLRNYKYLTPSSFGLRTSIRTEVLLVPSSSVSEFARPF